MGPARRNTAEKRTQTRQLVIGILAGAIMATVLGFALFGSQAFLPVPTLVPSLHAPPTSQPFVSVLPAVESVLITATPPPATATPPPTPTVVAAITVAEAPAVPLPTATFPIVTPLGSDDRITAVGDSVMLSAKRELERLIGTLNMDAEVGRSPSTAVEVMRALYARGELGNVVIIHIGNNGFFTEQQIDDIMWMVGEARLVVFVNVKVPRRWESPNNITMAQKIQQYPNAVLIDWYSASINRPELFYTDGVHLRPEGTQAYAALIAAVLTQQ